MFEHIVIVGGGIAAARFIRADRSTIPYDRLVLASGSVPRPLVVPGAQLHGVQTFRTLDEAEAARDAMTTVERVVVIGAGFIGKETAASLRSRFFGIKLGLLGDLGATADRRVTRGTLETGLVTYYLRRNRLIAALVSGQTPETQAELTRLLRERAAPPDPGTFADPGLVEA